MGPIPAHTLLAAKLLRWCASDRATLLDLRAPWFADDLRTFLSSRHIDSLLGLATGRPVALQPSYDAFLSLQLSAVGEIAEVLKSCGVDSLLLKGAALVPKHFHQAIGFMNDVDLLVRPEQVDSVRAALTELGYRHARFDRATGQLRDLGDEGVRAFESKRRELAPLAKAVAVGDDAWARRAKARDRHPIFSAGEGTLAIIEVDVHYALATGVDFNTSMSRSRRAPKGDMNALGGADQLILSLTKCYSDSAERNQVSLRPIALAVSELTRDEVEWDVVEQVAAECAVGRSLSAMLQLCSVLAPNTVPSSVFAAVHSSGRPLGRDAGWQVGRLFGFEEPFPTWAVDGSLDANLPE